MLTLWADFCLMVVLITVRNLQLENISFHLHVAVAPAAFGWNTPHFAVYLDGKLSASNTG